MRTAAAFLIAALPALVTAQEKSSEVPTPTTEVIGCVRGSVLTDVSTKRWRLRGPKPVMKELKKHDRQQVRLLGTSKEADSGYGGKRVGNVNIYVGGVSTPRGRDPLPELPTIDVASFEPTGETCR